MIKTAEKIKEEMLRRGIQPNNTNDLLLGGLMFSIEELISEMKKK